MTSSHLTLSFVALLATQAVAQSPAQQAPGGANMREPAIERGDDDQGRDIGVPQPQRPDPDLFELVGLVPLVPDPNHDAEVAHNQQAVLELTPEELDRVVREAAARARPEDDLAMLHTIGGELYRERAAVLERQPPGPEDEERESRPPDSDDPVARGGRAPPPGDRAVRSEIKARFLGGRVGPEHAR